MTTLKLLTVWITTNRKILKEMGISYHLTCLLRNLYVGQEAIVRTRHGTMNWFKIGKGVQGCMLLPCLFKLYVEYIMQNVRLDESQAEIKIAGRNINNPRYADVVKSLSQVWLLQPQGLKPARLLCSWDFPGKNTGVGCHFLLQAIFLTQRLNLHLLLCRQFLYRLSHQGSLKAILVFYLFLYFNS